MSNSDPKNDIQVIKPRFPTTYHTRFGASVKKFDPEKDRGYLGINNIWEAYTGIRWEGHMEFFVLREGRNPRICTTCYDHNTITCTHIEVYDKLYQYMRKRGIEPREVPNSPSLYFPQVAIIDFIKDFLTEKRGLIQ